MKFVLVLLAAIFGASCAHRAPWCGPRPGDMYCTRFVCARGELGFDVWDDRGCECVGWPYRGHEHFVPIPKPSNEKDIAEECSQ